ncbi:hypothetical protein BN136_3337 [Cronobacter universalis NCTC 9529]|nr:hypothetical protein BN136_3337 [Cronobacter universalis NCTC 9529]
MYQSFTLNICCFFVAFIARKKAQRRKCSNLLVNKIASDLLRYIYRNLVAETLNNFVYHSVRHYF